MAKHVSSGIIATDMAWRALGYSTFSDGTASSGPYNGEELLVLALAQGLTGNNAVAWAIAERQRRAEVQAIQGGIAASAKAIEKLAIAIRGASKSSVSGALDDLLCHLTERTAYAVRQQLKAH